MGDLEFSVGGSSGQLNDSSLPDGRAGFKSALGRFKAKWYG